VDRRPKRRNKAAFSNSFFSCGRGLRLTERDRIEFLSRLCNDYQLMTVLKIRQKIRKITVDD